MPAKKAAKKSSGGTKPGGSKSGGSKKGGSKKSATRKKAKSIVRRVLAGAAAGLVSGAVAAALPPLEETAGITPPDETKQGDEQK